jgi:periplasmic protein TonB
VALVATENYRFKQNYNKYIRNAFIAAIAVHVMMVVFTPKITYKPFVLREQYFQAISLPEQFELPPAPKEVAAPVVPIEAAEGEEADENAEIAPTSFDKIEDVPPPPPPASEAAQEFYAFDEPPVLIKFVNPKYPDLARQAGIEGTVLLRVLVGDDGKVINVSVIQSDVTPAMEKAAMEAAKQFAFRPAKQRTVSVKASVAVPIRFKLH